MKRFLRIIGAVAIFYFVFGLLATAAGLVGPIVSNDLIGLFGTSAPVIFLVLSVMTALSLVILLCCLAICWEVAFGE